MSAPLPRELLGPNLWRATEQAQVPAAPTGFKALDALLPGGGWPIGAVSEILHPSIGAGEFSLSLPLFARLTRAGKPVALIAPPHVPHAPRLQASGLELSRLLILEPDHPDDALWAAELLLRAGGSVLLWIEQAETQSLRRLQLAAESSETHALLIRPERFAREFTPSALRLRVWRDNGVPQVEVLKCRGASGTSSAVQVTSTALRAA